MKKEIAIIGYGRFGKLLAHHLKRWFKVVVAEKNHRRSVEHGVTQVSLKDAASKQILILCVPIRQLKPVLKSIAPFLTPGTLVCDVCSVKEQPLLWMKTLLPQYVYLLGTHPLFGPDSASGGIQGKNITLCPLRIPRDLLRTIKTQLQRHGINIQVMTPREHDRLMASTLFLTQFIGHGLRSFRHPPTTMTTQNYKILSHLITVAANDSAELFQDMYRYNDHTHTIPRRVLTELKKLFLSLPK